MDTKPSPTHQTEPHLQARAGDLIEAEIQTYRDGEPAGTRTLRVRLDRDPWSGGPGNTVVSDGRGVDAVLTDSIRIIERAPAVEGPTTPTFAEQRPAVAALAAMVEAFPHLSRAYIILPHVYPGTVQVTVHDAAHFEAWREALRIPPSAVELHHFEGSSWLAAAGAFSGASVEVSCHAIPDVEVATDEGRLAEQRHQMDPMDAVYRAVGVAGTAVAS